MYKNELLFKLLYQNSIGSVIFLFKSIFISFIIEVFVQAFLMNCMAKCRYELTTHFHNKTGF